MYWSVLSIAYSFQMRRETGYVFEKNKQGFKWNLNCWMAFLIFAVLWGLSSKKQKSHPLSFKSVVIQATWEWYNNILVNSFSVYWTPAISNTINVAEFFLKCSLAFLLLTSQNSQVCAEASISYKNCPCLFYFLHAATSWLWIKTS